MTLSNRQIDHFIEHGYIFIRGAIPRVFIDTLWTPRKDFLKFLKGFDDKSHLYFPVIGPRWKVKEIAPQLDTAITQLIGEDSTSQAPRSWGDGFVVAKPMSHVNYDNINISVNKYAWHKDGFHRHFLDSPEIGIIVLIMWTNFTDRNGATAIAKNSVKPVASTLMAHPEGLDEDFFDTHQFTATDNFDHVRAIGEAGDVCLMHPMLLHALRPNLSVEFRALTNPVVPLSKPMNFNRRDGRYSPVEQAVLHALGLTSLDFVATGPRGTTRRTDISSELDIMRSALRNQIEEYVALTGGSATV